MRQWIKVLVLTTSLVSAAEAQNDKHLLKIHKLRLEGDWQAWQFADLATDWLKHSVLGWTIVDQSEPADAALVLDVTREQETVGGGDDCPNKRPQSADRSPNSEPPPKERGAELAPGIVKDCKTGHVEFDSNSAAYRKTSSKIRLHTVLSLHALPQSKSRPLFRKDLGKTDLGEFEPQTVVRGLSQIEKSVLKLRDKQTK
jgi:hypothetical protein